MPHEPLIPWLVAPTAWRQLGSPHPAPPTHLNPHAYSFNDHTLPQHLPTLPACDPPYPAPLTLTLHPAPSPLPLILTTLTLFLIPPSHLLSLAHSLYTFTSNPCLVFFSFFIYTLFLSLPFFLHVLLCHVFLYFPPPPYASHCCIDAVYFVIKAS